MRGVIIVVFTALLGLSFVAETTAGQRGAVRVEVGELQFAPAPGGAPSGAAHVVRGPAPARY